MTAVQQRRRALRRRVLDAVRYRPDTASGVAERLLIKEEAARSHLASLNYFGKVHIARFDDRNTATWAYGPRGDSAANKVVA